MKITVNNISMDHADLVIDRVDYDLARELGMPDSDVAIGWWFFGDNRYGITLGILGPLHFEGKVQLGPLVPGRDFVSDMDSYFYATQNYPSAYDVGIHIGDPVIFPYWLGDDESHEHPMPTLGLVTDISPTKVWVSVKTPEGGVLDFRLTELRIPQAGVVV